MSEDLSLREFLEVLAGCSGDEAIDVVAKFQVGAITVEGISADEYE